MLSGLLLMYSFHTAVASSLVSLVWHAFPAAVKVFSATGIYQRTSGPCYCWRPFAVVDIPAVFGSMQLLASLLLLVYL
jgi:hypothetical protein